MTTVKIYKNTTDIDINVIGIGVIPAGEQVSISSQYHQPVVLANFPGVVEVTADDYVDPNAGNSDTGVINPSGERGDDE